MAYDASNAQKTPFASNINQFADRKVREAIDGTGKALPCSVVEVFPNRGTVTIKFEIKGVYQLPNIEVPHFGPEYIRYPTRAGDLGVVFPADAYLGGVSGLGGGVADFSDRGNLSALVFFPIGNKNWSANIDPNSVNVYGPNGVILRDINTRTTLTLTPAGVVIHLPNGITWSWNSGSAGSGITCDLNNVGPLSIVNGDLHVTGAIIAGFGTGDQVGLQTHKHTQPNDSHGDGEQPTNPPIAGT